MTSLGAQTKKSQREYNLLSARVYGVALDLGLADYAIRVGEFASGRIQNDGAPFEVRSIATRTAVRGKPGKMSQGATLVNHANEVVC